MLSAKPIQTEILRAGMPIEPFLISHLKQFDLEGKIVAVTSKIVSVAENRFVKKGEIEKESLVKRESDSYLGSCEYGCHLTIKEGLLIPSAGIDESNSEFDDYILYPKNPFKSARSICKTIKENFRLENLGVVLTDSHTTPLRKGVLGAALAFYGFSGIKNKVGTPDLFGKPLAMTTINVADSLAVAATLVMGEGNESCPLALLDYPVSFEELQNNSEIKIPPSDDLYKPLFERT